MLNEHHQTATCMLSAAPVALGVLARETKQARLLILGNPIVNRTQPIRVAEEMAYVDVLSRGRLDCGFVRGVPYEIAPANAYPYRGSEKLWEAHDLIMKAWTHHDGPFNFEGRWFHARQVNIWPRPYQQPHPPVWVTMGSAGSAAQVAQRRHIGAVFLPGYANIRKLFDGYRQGYLQAHAEETPLDRLACAVMIYVADSKRKAEEGAEKLLWYHRSNKIAPQFNNPPGYHSPAVAANIMRGPKPGEPDRLDPRLETEMARGNVFSGTPDQVFQQLKTFWEYSGGFGHLLMMGQAGFMTMDETLSSMSLFSQEVYPRLKELTASYDPGTMKEIMSSQPDVEDIDVGLAASEFVR
jgi:alkanesulfonate monooxygenase SsuD/methylene tetrahydromethanopterin reductase-like flavin-dependent oxidoreductase (luciferase family)